MTYQVKIDVPDFPKDLPESDGIPMESPWHHAGMTLLIDSLTFFWRSRTDFFAGGNMFLYFSAEQAMNRDYRGPDFFVVRGVDRTKARTTWKVWEENGRYPNVIVELLSPSTANEDRTTKKDLYEQTFRTPEYYLYDPTDGSLAGWRLANGRYQPMKPNARGWLWSDELGLWLGTWTGKYLDITATWPRFFDEGLQLVPARAETAETAAESAQQLAITAQHQVEDERRSAEAARQQAAEAQQRAAEATRRAEEECRRADEERRRAEKAQQQAEATAAKYARIQAWLAQQGITPPTNGGTNP